MNKAELFAKVDSTWLSAKRKQELKTAVEEYSSALIATKPFVSGVLPLALSFHQWMINKGWTKHSSGEYYYRSKDFHQWPPDETATEDELLKMFGGNDR